MKELLWDESITIDQLEKMLAAGDVILSSTDTVLGLLADISQKGRLALDTIKKRCGKPYLVLVADKKSALSLIEISPHRTLQIEKLIKICWPGPVTLIFKAKKPIHLDRSLHNSYVFDEDTIALRVPHHHGLQRLLQRFTGLFSTSANSSGAPVPLRREDVEECIREKVACIVDDSVCSDNNLPSTILDCTGDIIKVVREGMIDSKVIEGQYGHDFEKQN